MHRTRPHQFTLLYECEHAGQGVFDDARAILVHFATETDRVRHIAPHRRARLFKFAEQKCFVGASGKECLDRFDMGAGHGKNVRGATYQRCGDRLAAQAADVCAFFCADLYRIEARRLATHRMHTGRNNFDIFAVP